MLLLDASPGHQRRIGASEGHDRQGRSNVARWAERADVERLFISATTVHEWELGVLLAERRDPRQGAVLRLWLQTRVLTAFGGRALPIDVAVARRAALLHVPHPRPASDALIAATALVHGMTVVTRNVADFAATGVPILNPWHAPP